MAWAGSGLFVGTMVDQWDPSDLSIDLTSETDLKAAFWTASITPDYDAATPAYGSAPWNSGESSGAGYTAGGIAVINTTLAIASGKMRFDAENFSITNSTISAQGYLLYADANSDRAVCAVDFGSLEETQDGTFLVTHSGNGIFEIDCVP